MIFVGIDGRGDAKLVSPFVQGQRMKSGEKRQVQVKNVSFEDVFIFQNSDPSLWHKNVFKILTKNHHAWSKMACLSSMGWEESKPDIHC